MQLKQIVFNKEKTNNEYVSYEKALMPKSDFKSEELCNDDDGFFPQPRYMTGEWYLGRICMDEDYLSVETRFIGIDTGKKDDYLGLK